MTTPNPGILPPFHLQPVLQDLYHAKDLLDFNAPAGPSTPSRVASPPPITGSGPTGGLFSSATSIAAAAGRRAAAVASAATGSPGSTSSAQFLRSTGVGISTSPDRRAASATGTGVAGSAGGSGSSGHNADAEVRCVEGYGNNLYIGSSDGIVEWWVCDGGMGSSQGQGWTLRHKYTVFPRRAISQIVLCPKVSRILILSDGTIHPLALPNLEVLPSTVIPPMRGVSTIIVDDEELEWGGPGSEHQPGATGAGLEMTIVLVRRKGLGIYKLGSRMVNVKEIPLPSAPTHHALFSRYLCAAIPSVPNTPNSPLNYSLIDLSDASLTEVLPVSQIDADQLDFIPNPNIVVIPGENEFLVTSYTGASTMGVFLNGQGDPVRGTMEWEDHPLSIAIDTGYIIALLRNNTIVIHSLADLDAPAQTITIDPGLRAFALSYSPYGISVRDNIRDERMRPISITLLGGKLAPTQSGPPRVQSPPIDPGQVPIQPGLDTLSPGGTDTQMEGRPSAEVSPLGEEPPSGSGLTPPSSPPTFQRQPIPPTRSSSLLRATAPPISTGPFSTTIAETLVVGPNGISSIAPTPVILKVEKLCSEHKLDEAVSLVDEERRKGRRGEVDSDKVTHQATMRFLHLFLACHLFIGGMFERAGDYFLRGKIDPRLVVRAFPALRGKVIGSAEEVEVFEGLKGVLEAMPDIEEIESIKRNYTQDDTDDKEDNEETTPPSAPDLDNLRIAMLDSSKSMLTEVLRKTRQSRRKGGGSRGLDSRKIDIVIDTTLAKLLAEAGTTNELLTILAGPNDVVLGELEPFLVMRPYILSKVMRQQGKIDRVLQLLQEVAESSEADPLCPEPEDEIASQLETVNDPELFRRYILWLVKRTPDKAMTLLISSHGKSIKLDETALIDDLRSISDDAADRYLEHIVVGKKSPNKALHQELLDRLLVAAIKEVQDDGVKYHLEELDAEYRLSPDPEPFCIFLADVAPASPVKLLRLKLMLFLQGSPFYNLEAASKRLEQCSPLRYELAVVLGKLGRHRSALRLLAKDIADSTSAQTYCTQGGEIIPPRLARRVASRIAGLEHWAALTEIGRKRRDTTSDVEPKIQEGLVMELLGVYMRDGAASSHQTAALLNAQSVHLDVLEVLDLVPNEWPLDGVSSFLQRSIRRQIHERATWQILKAISAGENLQTSQAHLTTLSKIPPIIQHTPPKRPTSGAVEHDSSQSLPSRPDEGSIAEKEFGHSDIEFNGQNDEKIDIDNEVKDEVDSEGSEKIVAKSSPARGFFTLEGVDKELRKLSMKDLRAEAGMVGSNDGDDGEEGDLR